MKKLKIVGIVGSLRKASLNAQLAQMAAKLCEEEATFTILDYHELPLMNEDIEVPAPAVVERLRKEIAEADGVWFFSPEYNHSYSGVLKNLFDWLSRPDAKQQRVLAGKPAAVSGISIGMSGTLIGQDQLVTLLSFLDMKVMNVPRVTIPYGNQQVVDGKLEVTESAKYVEAQGKAFLAFVREASEK